MRIAMREIAADARDIAHTHIGERLHGLRHDRQMLRDQRSMFQFGECRHRADADAAIGAQTETRKRLDAAQAHQLRRPEQLRLHHQHQRRSAAHGPDRRIIGVRAARKRPREIRARRVQVRACAKHPERASTGRRKARIKRALQSPNSVSTFWDEIAKSDRHNRIGSCFYGFYRCEHGDRKTHTDRFAVSLRLLQAGVAKAGWVVTRTHTMDGSAPVSCARKTRGISPAKRCSSPMCGCPACRTSPSCAARLRMAA